MPNSIACEAKLSHAPERADDHSTDIVPLTERRGPVTMGLLWVTMVTGFPTVLVGFEWFKAGLTLSQVLLGIGLSCLILLLYGIPSTFLGSRSGQTYSLLSRKVFGRWGSRLVSWNLVWVSIAWYGLTANFLAEGLKGLYAIDLPTVWLAAGFAVLMGFNNFFGFSGIANFAKYLAAPVLILWVGYTFSKAAIACPVAVWHMSAQQPLPHALTLVSAFVVGYGVWGNEADYWRYGKPGKLHAAIPLVVALSIGQVLFPITGYLLGYMTHITEMGAATNLMNSYAFGGMSAIAAIVLVVTYFAVNDSGLYGSVNGVENLKKMPHRLAVGILTMAGVGTSVLLCGNPRAFEIVATTSSIVLPSATVIMLMEYFVIKRKSERERDFARIPQFAELSPVRLGAVVALLSGCAVGFLTSGLIPGCEQLHWGVCSMQSWATTMLVYLAVRLPNKRRNVAAQRRFLDRLLMHESAGRMSPAMMAIKSDPSAN